MQCKDEPLKVVLASGLVRNCGFKGSTFLHNSGLVLFQASLETGTTSFLCERERDSPQVCGGRARMSAALEQLQWWHKYLRAYTQAQWQWPDECCTR